MLRSKRFQPIQEIVASAADELSRPMVEASRRVADLERQLEQLKAYRDEYAGAACSGADAIDAVKLQNFRSFLDKLDFTQRQHVVKLEAARAEYEKRRLQWSQKRIEVQSLDRAIQRFRVQEQHAAEQREQREGDDAAMRMALARIAVDNPVG